jgi:drug/metabolite transporter (DMT)-like permease
VVFNILNNWLFFGSRRDRQVIAGAILGLMGIVLTFWPDLQTYALLSGAKFTFDGSVGYIGSLFYLALFGSVIAFSAYLTLVGRIGSDRAAYMSVLFPMVALLFSAAFEKYHMTLLSAFGIACVLAGNGLVLLRKRRINPTFPTRDVAANTKGTEG